MDELFIGGAIAAAIGLIVIGWRLGRGDKRRQMQPVQMVSEGELVEMFKHAPDSPTYKATLAVLDLETVAAVERSVDERLSDQQMRYRLGGVAALLEFKQELEDRAAQARRAGSGQQGAGS